MSKKRNANFNRILEGIHGGEVEVLNLRYRGVGVDEARALSLALMNESNKVTTLNLSLNNIGDAEAQFYQLH